MRRFLFLFILVLLPLLAFPADKKFVVVIDAGHGGRDHGAVGARSREKDLTLKYALAFGRMLERNCPDVKVVYTRKTDVFLELWHRAEIANKCKADLFLSFHINAIAKSKNQVHGYQTYTLGSGETTGKQGIKENLEVAKRENSVILLEKDYKQTYQGFDPNSSESNILFEFMQDNNMERSVDLAKLMQKYICSATGRKDMGAHQNNLAVLRLTSMPGCLLEFGYISHPEEERYMNTDVAVDQYVRGIYNAFREYRRKYDTVVNMPKAPAQPEQPQTEQQAQSPSQQQQQPSQPQQPKQQTQPTQPTPAAGASGRETQRQSNNGDAPVFKVQILTSDRVLKPNDKLFKGLEGVDYYTERGIKKYTVGASTDYNEIYQLRKRILDKFPQAFIIAFNQKGRMDVNEAIRQFKARKR